MTGSPHDEALPRNGDDSASAMTAHSPHEDRVVSLRGASPVSVGRRFWLIAGAIVLVIFAVVLAISFVSVSRDNARIDRLKTNGVHVRVTITNCAGNVGGSGSNGAGYACHGEYTVGATTYHELIGSMTTFAATGTHVRGVADPLHHGTVVLASAIKESKISNETYVAPVLLTMLLVALLLAYFRTARRRAPGTQISE
jgi:hypothetical protein